MRIILLSVASIIITAACLFHPLYPTELGLFDSGWIGALSALLMLWYELKQKARANDLLMLSMLFTLSMALCLAGLFDWLELAMFAANANAEGFYSGAILGILLGIWVGYRVLGRPAAETRPPDRNRFRSGLLLSRCCLACIFLVTTP